MALELGNYEELSDAMKGTIVPSLETLGEEMTKQNTLQSKILSKSAEMSQKATAGILSGVSNLGEFTKGPMSSMLSRFVGDWGADKIVGSLGGTFGKLGNVFQDKFSSITDYFVKDKTKAIPAFEEDRNEYLQNIAYALGEGKEDISDTLKEIAKGIEDVDGGMMFFGKGMLKWLLAAALLVGKTILVAITAIVVSVFAAWAGWNIGKWLNEQIDKAFGVEGGLGIWVYDFLHGGIQEAFDKATGWGIQFKDWIWDGIVSGFETLDSWDLPFKDWLWEGVTSGFAKLDAWEDKFQKWVWDSIESGFDILDSWGLPFKDWLWEGITSGFAKLDSWRDQFRTWIWDGIVSGFDILDSWDTQFKEWMWESITLGFEKIGDFGDEVGAWLRESISSVYDYLSEWDFDLGSKIFDWVKESISGIADTTIPLASDVIKAFASTMADAVKDVPFVGERLYKMLSPEEALPEGRIGAFVEQSGAAVVHEKELIIPAELTPMVSGILTPASNVPSLDAINNMRVLNPDGPQTVALLKIMVGHLANLIRKTSGRSEESLNSPFIDDPVLSLLAKGTL